MCHLRKAKLRESGQGTPESKAGGFFFNCLSRRFCLGRWFERKISFYKSISISGSVLGSSHMLFHFILTTAEKGVINLVSHIKNQAQRG